MFGKLSLLFLVLILLLGCTTKETSSKKIIIPDYETVYSTTLDKKEITDLFTDAKECHFTDNLYVSSYYLNDDGNYFVASKNDETNTITMDCVNLKTQQDFHIVSFDNLSETATLNIIDGTSRYIVFDLYDQNTSKYFIYDIQTNTLHLMTTIENLNSLHDTTMYFADEKTIYLSLYDTTDNTYKIYQYNTETNILTLFLSEEKQNLGYPIYYNDTLYYLLINSTDFTVDLMVYNLNTKEKNSLYQTTTADAFLSGIYCYDEAFFFTIKKDEDVELFQMDLSTLKTTYLFTNKQMDRVRLNHQYITWVGEISSPNRIRMQYYLYDYQNQIYYDNPEGITVLSRNYMIWRDYLKEDNEIPKGEIFNSENTVTKYIPIS